MCDLCQKDTFKFYITFCRTHPDAVLIVSTEHKPSFSNEEKALIRRMFPGKYIRWEQRSIPDHAHCHITDTPPLRDVHPAQEIWCPIYRKGVMVGAFCRNGCDFYRNGTCKY